MTQLHSKSGDGYSAVGAREDGTIEVHLAPNHPGANDPEYRARRGSIASAAIGWQAGDPLPDIDYSDREHDTWRVVCSELQRAWRANATASFLDGVEALALPADHVPQLRDVGEALAPLTGFRYQPVAGLAPLRTFYESFGEGVFWSTQYLRHHREPLYTPEPDLCHEVLGHANQLADPRFADLYRHVARTVARLETQPALGFLSKIFWFTVEFGVVWEGRDLRAYGAGLLSSFGELGAFRGAEVRDLDWVEMGTIAYDITHYQPVLYAGRSMDDVFDRLTSFLDGYDDEVHARLLRSAA